MKTKGKSRPSCDHPSCHEKAAFNLGKATVTIPAAEPTRASKLCEGHGGQYLGPKARDKARIFG